MRDVVAQFYTETFFVLLSFSRNRVLVPENSESDFVAMQHAEAD